MKRIAGKIKEEDKGLTLKKYYGEVTALLQNIALEIDAYIDFCFGGDAFEDKQTRESEGEGEKILDIIQHSFNSLKKKPMSWYSITPGTRPQRDYIAINDNTAMIDYHSRNIYNIRINLQAANTPIYRQTDKNEKEKIKDLCDNYFDSLLELNDLMEPCIKENNRIHKVWPFKALDSRKSRANILEWVNQLLNNTGVKETAELLEETKDPDSQTYAELYNKLVTKITILPLLFFRLKVTRRMVEAKQRETGAADRVDRVYGELDNTFEKITEILDGLRKKEGEAFFLDGYIEPQTGLRNFTEIADFYRQRKIEAEDSLSGSRKTLLQIKKSKCTQAAGKNTETRKWNDYRRGVAAIEKELAHIHGVVSRNANDSDKRFGTGTAGMTTHARDTRESLSASFLDIRRLFNSYFNQMGGDKFVNPCQKQAPLTELLPCLKERFLRPGKTNARLDILKTIIKNEKKLSKRMRIFSACSGDQFHGKTDAGSAAGITMLALQYVIDSHIDCMTNREYDRKEIRFINRAVNSYQDLARRLRDFQASQNRKPLLMYDLMHDEDG
jgi:hypothetical protein